MFSAYCPRHRSNVLLSEGQIRGLSNLDGSIVVDVECYDGERIRVVTGRRGRRPAREPI
jgi:hypothetical protein